MSSAIEIADQVAFDALIRESHEKPVLLLKLSPVCSMSFFAQRQFQVFLEKAPDGVIYRTLDVVGKRPLSRHIAEALGVVHESPQALLIQDGRCVWHDSHGALSSEIFGQRTAAALKLS